MCSAPLFDQKKRIFVSVVINPVVFEHLLFGMMPFYINYYSALVMC